MPPDVYDGRRLAIGITHTGSTCEPVHAVDDQVAPADPLVADLLNSVSEAFGTTIRSECDLPVPKCGDDLVFVARRSLLRDEQPLGGCT